MMGQIVKNVVLIAFLVLNQLINVLPVKIQS